MAKMVRNKTTKPRSLPEEEPPSADPYALLMQGIAAATQDVQRASKDFARVNVRRIQLRKLNIGPDTHERIEIIARYESTRRVLSKAKSRLRGLLARKRGMKRSQA